MGIASALALGGGCFADPPMVEGNDTTGVGSTGTTGADSGETMVADETAADETAGTDSGEPVCEDTPADLFLLPSDIVVGVDLDIPDPNGVFPGVEAALDAVLDQGPFRDGQGQHVALIAPPGLMFNAQCAMGCGRCATGVESVFVLAESAGTHPQEVFLPESGYACVFRPPVRGEQDAYRTYVHVTTQPAPSTAMPRAFLNIVDSTGATYNVVCPGCDGTQPVEEFAALTGGLSANLSEEGALGELIQYAGAPRVACAWLPDPPPGYTIDDASLVLNSTVFPDVQLERVPSYEDCAGLFDDDFVLQWTSVSEDGVDIGVLCPTTCFVAQLEPAFPVAGSAGVSIQQSFCH